MVNETAEEETKPPDRTTVAPIRATTTRVHPPATRVTQAGTRSDNGVTSSSGSTDNVDDPSLSPTPDLKIDSGEDTTSRGGGEDVEAPPAPTLPPPSRIEEDRRPIHEVISPVGGGIADESSSWPSAGGGFPHFPPPVSV